MNLSGVSANRSVLDIADQSNNAGVLLSGNITSNKGGTTNLNLVETDYGAVEGSLDFAYNIGQGFIDFGDKALTAVKEASDGAVAAVNKSNSAALDRVSALAESKSSGAPNKTILYIIGGAFVVVGVVVYVSGAKK